MTIGTRIRADHPSPPPPPQQRPSSASLYLAGALPRLGLEQMALEVPEADGDLVQRGSTLEPQVTFPELSYRHPNEQGGLRLQQPFLCPWGQGCVGAQNGAAWEGTICLSPAREQLGLGRAEAAQGCKRLRHSKEGSPSPHSCNPFN